MTLVKMNNSVSFDSVNVVPVGRINNAVGFSPCFDNML